MENESNNVKLDPALLWEKLLLKYISLCKFNISSQSIMFASIQSLWSEGLS